MLEELLANPVVQSAVPLLVVVLVAAIILKVTKGCIKFLIAVIIIAAIVIYVMPNFIL